jgi:hypothetical protein
VKLSAAPKVSAEARLQCAACGAQYRGTEDGRVLRLDT